MKIDTFKSLLCISFGAMAFTAVAQTNYQITGSLANNEGTMVYMNTIESRSKTPIDSAVVTEGKFFMKGSISQASELAYIYSAPRSKAGSNKAIPVSRRSSLFWIDSTPLTINIDKGVMKGSKENNGLSEIKESFNTLFEPVEVEQEAMKNKYGDYTKAPDAEKAKLQSLIDDLHKKAIEKTLSMAEENLSSINSLLLMTEYAPFFSAEKIEDMMMHYSGPTDNSLFRKLENTVAANKKKAVGASYMDFTLPDRNGKMRKLSDFAGKGNPVLVDFWASWCGPCRAEMPHVKAAYDKYHAKGFEVVGVSLDSNKAAWENGISQLNIIWPQLSSLKGWSCEVAKLYDVKGIPFTILIDGKGKILGTNLRGEALMEALDSIYK